MPLWGGCEDYLIKALQIVQNKAARSVTRLWDAPIKTLLHQCNWLSVNQLIKYNTLVLQYKILQNGYPRYLYDKLDLDFPRNTRLAQSNIIRMGPEFQAHLALTEKSFRWRAAKDWNELPSSIRQVRKLETFKKELKSWIKNNLPI